MAPHEELQVHCDNLPTKTVTVISVMRGRVVVDWPLVGKYDIDLLTGELFAVPTVRRGVISVDIETGRDVSNGQLMVEDLASLERARVGDEVVLMSGYLAQVVDVLASEGTIRVYVNKRYDDRKVSRIRYRVSASDLSSLRQRAGCIAIAS